MKETIKAADGASASLVMGSGVTEEFSAPYFTYSVECVDKTGNVKWAEETRNVVTTEGKNDLLNKYFKGSAYTAAWYVGLIDNASFTAVAAGDTAAQINGSNGWLELSEFTEGVRQTLTLGTPSAGSVDNSASKASFSMNATKTVNGAFVVTTSVVDGVTGVLYSAASFSAARAVANGDTLNVTVTLTA